MDTRKKKLFIAAGGAAVVLVAGLVVWSPDFPREDASGAIGTVQKHRQTQIAPQDVILSDEATRKAEHILYADFLTDAAKLENMSADLGIIAILIGNRQQNLGSDVTATLSNVEASLANHSMDLQSRYLASMTESLNALDQLASEEQVMLGDSAVELQSMTADLNSLAAKGKNQLESADMLSLNSRLQSFVEQLASMELLQNVDMQLESKKLESMSADLGSMVENLQNAVNLENEVSLASKKLGNFSAELGSRQQNSLGMSDRIEYLGSLALQHKSALEARQELASFADALAMGNVVELQSSVDDLSASLGSDAVTLESMALDNLNQRLQSATAMDAALNNMEAMLGSARNQLASRSASLESRNLASFTESLANLTAELQNKRADLQSDLALNMQFELASIEAHLSSRQQIESRVLGSGKQLGINVAQLQNRHNFGDRVALGNEVQLESRGKNLGNAGGFDAYLGNLSAALESKNSFGSRLQNREQLGAQVMMLENTVEQLESKRNQ